MGKRQDESGKKKIMTKWKVKIEGCNEHKHTQTTMDTGKNDV